MLKKQLALIAIVCTFWSCNLQAVQIQSTWVGGDQDDWGVPSNWKPAIVPDNTESRTFAVTINAADGEVEVGLRERHTIDRLDCYGEVHLSIWPHDWQNHPVKLIMVDPKGLTNHGNLKLEFMDIKGNVTNTAGAMLCLSDMEMEGDLYNHIDATLESECGNSVEGILQNDGTITIISASFFACHDVLHNNGLINIYGAICTAEEILDNNGVIRGFGILYIRSLLQNKGHISAYGGSLSVSVINEGALQNSGLLSNSPLSLLHIKPAEDVNNQGTIEIYAGGGIAFDCNAVNEPNGVVKLLGGTLAAKTITQKAGATLEGFGGITGNLVIEPNAVVKLTGPTNIVGDVNIAEGATLEIRDGTILITGKVTCKGTIHLKGGQIISQGGLSGNCNIIREPSVSTVIADFNLDGNIDLNDFADLVITWLGQTD